MAKILIATAFVVIGIMTWKLSDNAPSFTPSASGAAITVVRDADSGELRAPTRQERQTISQQRQSGARTKSKIHYTKKMKRYADGTRTGVVDPIHTHKIYASLDQNGNVVVHENLAPPMNEKAGALK